MKHLFSLAALLALGCSLAFAGGGKQGGTGSGTAAQTWETVRLNQSDYPMLVPYDQPVVMNIASAEYIGIEYEFPTDNEADNVWTRAYRKYLNIDIRTKWVSSDYSTNMNLAIASRDLPDVFLVNDNQFVQLLDAGMIEDVTAAFESTASDFIKGQYQFASSIVDAFKRNGRLYGFPRLNWGDISVPHFMWYRKDWMAALGFSGDPKTIDEMLSRVQAMNARYGTKGMAVDKSIGDLIGIAPMWHAAPKVWITSSDGKIVYGSVQPEMKTALAAFADWYKRGLINSNFAVEDSDTVKTDVINGKYGAQPFPQWWGWYAGRDVVNNNNKNAYFEPYKLPSVDGRPVLTPLPFSNDNTLVVRKGYAHPEAVAKLISFNSFIDFEAEKRGVISHEDRYYYDRLNTTVPFTIRPPSADYDQYYEAQEFKKTGDYSVYSASGNVEKMQHALIFLETGDTSPGNSLGGLLQVAGDRTAYGISVHQVEKDEFIRSKLWGAIPEAVSRYGTTLDDLLLEGFTQIILGSQPIGYFDTLAKDWYSAGGQEMTDAVNAMYGKK
jgi:putative aldouronate transport system substrate-binding protein